MNVCPISDGGQGRLITCRVDELRPHPGYLRHRITVPASRVSLLAGAGRSLLREPLQITRHLDCLEYELSEEDALLWLIQKHQRSDGLNAFCRILLALELEPWFKARARVNQQLGGQKKGSSNLAKADRLDVRSEIAAAAGVSTGNIGKVKQLASVAHPHVLEALRASEVSIHRASVWLQKPGKQLDALGVHRNRRGITATVNALLRAHHGDRTGEQLDAPYIAAALARCSSEQSGTILVAEIKVPGEVLLVSTALRQTLTSQGVFNI